MDDKEYKRRAARAYRERLREQGLCISCGRRKAMYKQSRCFECAEVQRLSSARIQKYRRDNHLCLYCGKPLQSESIMCDACREKHYVAVRKHYAKVKAERSAANG